MFCNNVPTGKSDKILSKFNKINFSALPQGFFRHFRLYPQFRGNAEKSPFLVFLAPAPRRKKISGNCLKCLKQGCGAGAGAGAGARAAGADRFWSEPEPEPEPPKRFARSRSRSRSRQKRGGSGSEKGYNCGKKKQNESEITRNSRTNSLPKFYISNFRTSAINYLKFS